MTLTESIKKISLQIGFDHVGIADTQTPNRDITKYKSWIKKKMHGDMKYLEKISQREKIQSILPNAKSIIICALNYNQKNPTDNTEYKVAKYALGKDYHKVVSKKLRILWSEIKKLKPYANGKYYVDTGPILERAFAQKAGLGWIGKNTMLISKTIGSYIFLGEIITNLELEYDTPATNHCGTCSACLDACPTSALPQPGSLDATKCISYLTIEKRGAFTDDINTHNYLFGCDICQEVCPWNGRAPETKEARFTPLPLPALTEYKSMSEIEYHRWFDGRPLRRTGKSGLQRNATLLRRTLQVKH